MQLGFVVNIIYPQIEVVTAAGQFAVTFAPVEGKLTGAVHGNFYFAILNAGANIGRNIVAVDFQLPDLLAAGLGAGHGGSVAGDVGQLKSKAPIFPVQEKTGFRVNKLTGGDYDVIFSGAEQEHLADGVGLAVGRVEYVVCQSEVIGGIMVGIEGHTVICLKSFLTVAFPCVLTGTEKDFLLGDIAVFEGVFQPLADEYERGWCGSGKCTHH